MGLLHHLGLKHRGPLTIQDLIDRGYKQQYFEECKHIWQNWVPKAGQAENLQGELLRELEKLRREAQENGNINWDEDFDYFCVNIRDSLCAQPVFTNGEKEEIELIMGFLRSCGGQARKRHLDMVLEDQGEPDKLAYVNDDLYDRIADKIGFLQQTVVGPLPYEHNDLLRR